MSRLYNAMPNLDEGATANDKRKLDIAREAIDQVDSKVRALMNGPWKELLVESEKLEVTFEGVLEGVQRNE